MKLLITAGPTREPLDAVRFLSNRSSGKVGLSLARAAAGAGHDATLLLGPVCPPSEAIPGVEVVPFGSTADLRRALQERFAGCDALVMAAAVADYRPVEVIEGKLPRTAGPDGVLTLRLEPTPDLVAEAAARKRPGQLVIAFALEEPAKLEARAVEKMRRKGVDAILANPLSSMDGDTIEPTLFHAAGHAERPGPMAKAAFGTWLIDRVEAMSRGDAG